MNDPTNEFLERSAQADKDRLDATYGEYQRLLHAMQSGVAADHAKDASDGSPKHLRVGVNSAMITDAALANLLIGKGVFTEQELADALVTEARKEVERYERKLREVYGADIALH